MDERTQRALAAVDTTGRGLEIGPSYAPLLPKSSGARVEILDHASRDELVAKYEAWSLPAEKIARIEEVDHVSQGGSLVDVVGEEGVFDFILASNVIEHTVDLIGFLHDCQRLLTPTGRLSLIVPDKRFCFDFFKPLSSVGSVLDAHLAPTAFHPPGALLDHTAYACSRGGQVAWGNRQTGDVRLQFGDLTDGNLHVAAGMAQDTYHDTHRWRFTPAWFALMIHDLRVLGHHGMHEVATAPHFGFEFFVTLSPQATQDEPIDRLELLMGSMEELGEVAEVTTAATAHYERELRAARRELEEMRSSTSWRLTAPVRAVKDRIDALRARR